MTNPAWSETERRDGIKEHTTSFTQKYRFGFNKQEQETELGEYHSFEYRVHDARLGRFLSVDPLFHKFIFNSPYGFASNSPVSLADILGLAPGDPNTALTKGGPTQFLKDNGISSSSLAGWIPLLDNLAAANPDKFSDYEFSAVDSKKWNYWNSLANNKARWDKGMKFNVPKGNEEIGPAMARIKEFESLMTTSVFPSVTKKKFISDLRARVSTGGEQIIQSTNTCGLAALTKIFADVDPLGYTNFTIQLFTSGVAEHNKFKIIDSDAKDLGQWAKQLKSGYSNGNRQTFQGADLVLLGSLRFVLNKPNRFDIANDGGFSGLTYPWEIEELANDLINLKIKEKYSYPVAGTLQLSNYSSAANKPKEYVVLLLNDGPLLSLTYHYQVFNNGSINGLNFDYSYWDYGKTKIASKRAFELTEKMKCVWFFSK